ncbi:hypothetical protein [Planktotalea arctica]|uniref:hypothetical protein n=1 Tax=Planktotalea arctica TaxID=1481893 RepID=UPI000A172669|nr:hypothetical protein [Planktotalea arctica]
MDEVLAIPGGLGLGSLLTVIIQSIIQNSNFRSKRAFEEKKEAYVGLLEALQRAAIERTDQAAKAFAYWQMRCDLVGSKEVQVAIEELVESNDDVARRAKAML